MNKQTIYIKPRNPEEYLITLRNNIFDHWVEAKWMQESIVLAPGY